MSECPQPIPKTWPDYRAVWRWHFYAGLFCIPFVLVLAASGSIYLFKPQIEAWNDRAFDNLAITSPTSAADQVRAALAAVPGSTPSGYELPQSPRSAARVIVRKEGESIRVYVHPETLAILHTIPEDQRLMRVLFRLHGELWMGDRGSNLVELAASWTIIMIVTGLYLWWPRGAKGLGGILYPRLASGSRIFWRDWHSVTGIWISVFALLLLMTGLPWAKFWGNYFKTVRRITGTAASQQDWTTGRERSPGGGGEHAGHGGSSRRGRSSGALPKDLAALDRVVAAVRPLGLEHPVVIGPPSQGTTDWSAKSMTGNRPLRVNLVVNGETGQIVSREDFSDRHWVDQAVGYGIAAHEGQLFGWPNQLLGLLTALGLVLLSVSGVVMWWRRRDQGVLGAPKVLLNPRVSWGLLVLVVLLGVYLPLFGASLLLVLATEKLLLCRIPRVRDWLGLPAPGPVAVQMAAAAMLLALVAGCGPRPVAGGTKGTLQAAGQMLSDIQVTVHKVEAGAPEPIGFAVTAADGSFELVTNGAAGALWLPSGEYLCTLESAGAPVRIPPAYAKAETTPLKVTRTSGSDSLDLAIPEKLLP
jgi:uncharacterized iron-regulated membrane protein